jgi:hypothetical protein
MVYKKPYIGTMSSNSESKINRLLKSVPSGTVILSSWLRQNGYSLDLQKRYRKSNWLESVGSGAMIRNGDHLTWEGALFALQHQLNLAIHPGATTALALLGKAHYLELSPKFATLFGPTAHKLPLWFKNREWEQSIKLHNTDFLPARLGLVDVELKNFKLTVSGPARALMECLYLVPEHQSLLACHEVMEGLNNLRPAQVQELLESCNSIKVKRLFLYLAEKSGHEWLNLIQPERIDLGCGKRSIVKGGVYNSKFQITVDKELKASQ